MMVGYAEVKDGHSVGIVDQQRDSQLSGPNRSVCADLLSF